MEKTGSLVKTILRSVYNIDLGRKGLATDGKEHNGRISFSDMPKDAFHIACASHYTRINNTLRTPGINSIERQVYEQRLKNMSVAQSAYLSRQQSALAV